MQGNAETNLKNVSNTVAETIKKAADKTQGRQNVFIKLL